MRVEARPVLEIEATPLERALDLASVAALLFAVGDLAYLWPQLPERVPSHFNLSGEVDRYAGKWSLLLLPGISAAIVVGFTLLRRIPQHFNYPWAITPENAEGMYRAGRDLLTWLRTEIAVGFAALGHTMANMSLGGSPDVIAWFLPVLLVAVFGTIGWTLIRMLRAR